MAEDTEKKGQQGGQSAQNQRNQGQQSGQSGPQQPGQQQKKVGQGDHDKEENGKNRERKAS